MQSYFQTSFRFRFWGNAFKFDSECWIHWLPSYSEMDGSKPIYTTLIPLS